MNRSQRVAEQKGNDARQRLMISGVLTLAQPEGASAIVERGMSILSREGDEVGKVAAVSVSQERAVESILLARLPEKMEYRIVPVNQVAAVHAQHLVLTLTACQIEGLERWSTDSRK